MSLALYDLKQSNVSTYNSTLGWFENAGEVRSKRRGSGNSLFTVG
ncbi:Uncharacterised protein [Citrobacter koseri]|uniref:Uncharacterized protein n=1 Tax=Citrobacter koseri TaxID=545 RepID=A0A2X2V6V0_CITKO|nr:Uncharacterised protein [Citrobacter koseri]